MLKHRNCHPSERKQGIEMSYLPFSRLYFHTCCETIVFQKTEHERNAAPSGESNCFWKQDSATRIPDPGRLYPPGALCGASRPIV